jgi:predicted secreted protein
MRIFLVTAALAVAVAPIAAAKTYHRKDSGHAVKVHRGKTFKVRLSQASDGGYRWATKKKPNAAVLKLVKKRTIPGKCAQTAYCTGGNSTFVATYKAVGAGKAKINLVERRSFDKQHPVAHFRLRVTVR